MLDGPTCSLIANVKKVFRSLLNELLSVITRWGMRLRAAMYYATNFEDVSSVVLSLNPEEATSIRKAQKVLSTKRLREDLQYIQTNFECLVL